MSTESTESGKPDSADTEVQPKPKRRSFGAEYRRRIVEEADRCEERGQIGALLRREGLYSSQLAAWRKERDEEGLQPKRRGRPKKRSAQDQRCVELQQEILSLQQRNEQLQAVVEIQKKLCLLLGEPAPTLAGNRSPKTPSADSATSSG